MLSRLTKKFTNNLNKKLLTNQRQVFNIQTILVNFYIFIYVLLLIGTFPIKPYQNLFSSIKWIALYLTIILAMIINVEVLLKMKKEREKKNKDLTADEIKNIREDVVKKNAFFRDLNSIQIAGNYLFLLNPFSSFILWILKSRFNSKFFSGKPSNLFSSLFKNYKYTYQIFPYLWFVVFVVINVIINN